MLGTLTIKPITKVCSYNELPNYFDNFIEKNLDLSLIKLQIILNSILTYDRCTTT